MSLIFPLQETVGFQEEIQSEVLRRLHQTPQVSRRTLACAVGVALISLNFCPQNLVEKGSVKMQNFRKSKPRYAYLLTPAGVAEKTKLAADFLRRKVAGDKALQIEVEQLEFEIPSIIKRYP